MILDPCREDPGAGNIVTFAQFLFIALEGLVFTSNFLQKEAVVPLRYNLVQSGCWSGNQTLRVGLEIILGKG